MAACGQGARISGLINLSHSACACWRLELVRSESCAWREQHIFVEMIMLIFRAPFAASLTNNQHSLWRARPFTVGRCIVSEAFQSEGSELQCTSL
jgi:hypothetical protein